MRLYEIDEAITKALEDAIDPETGEVIDEALLAEFEQLQMERSAKLENIVCYIKDLTADAKAIGDELKALTARKRAAENRAASLKAYLTWALNGEKFSSARGSVSYRRSQSVEVKDVYALPEEFVRYKEPEPDKTAIKDAIKAGKDVPGAELVENVSTIIK